MEEMILREFASGIVVIATNNNSLISVTTSLVLKCFLAKHLYDGPQSNN